MPSNPHYLETQIQALQQQTQSYLQEIKELIEKRPTHKNSNVISYFTTSMNISLDTAQESLCLGSYHVYNIGNEPLTNPSICIKLPDPSPFSFSGKYVHEQLKKISKVQMNGYVSQKMPMPIK